ncbi:MAG TPA: spore maturation protein [Clostridiales bacterium]|nr:spore maturation protein [Clostridiales bacterium]
MNNIGAFVLPIAIGIIVLFGILKRVPVFDVFLQGAREGILSTYRIAPSIVGLVVAVSMLNASGAFQLLGNAISPVADFLGFPTQVLPLMLLRPVSGSGSLAVLNDILTSNGADSFAGRVAAVMMGSTETTFYAIAVYYGAIGIKKIRHTVAAALCADFAGAVMAVLTVRLFFS